MRVSAFIADLDFILPPLSFILAFQGRRSQVVRQRSAKPLFIGSIPIAASNKNQQLTDTGLTSESAFLCGYCASSFLFAVESVF
jgi:hypothetical protein